MSAVVYCMVIENPENSHNLQFSKKKNITENVLFKGECDNLLVSGPSGVPDGHMTASSYYEDSIYMDSPERARLNLEDERVQKDNGNYVILGGGWMAGDKDKNEWIQVRSGFERECMDVLLYFPCMFKK